MIDTYMKKIFAFMLLAAVNRFREAIGLNQRGKETIRVSMFGNRYNYTKALRFFGAHPTHGAQR